MLRVSEAVRHELKHRGVKLFNRLPLIEGKKCNDWMVVDGGSVIVNVMVAEARR